MSVTMREMLEAGVHFGHQTRFWDPKMAPYIFGHRNKIHIINLEKSLPLLQEATKFIKQLAANGGTIMMVGTKRQARDTIAAEAARAGVPFVNQRWLGGMMTNFKTVKTSIKRLKDMKTQQEAGLVTKVDTGFQHFAHGNGHKNTPKVGSKIQPQYLRRRDLHEDATP